jgi:hypothetical protein
VKHGESSSRINTVVNGSRATNEEFLISLPSFVQFGLVDVNESKNIILTSLMRLMIGITNNSEIQRKCSIS